MKNKTSQSGFTLIELIAVMVILGILAAVIIPRITTITSGAYESNVRNMYGLIKNEVTAQAVKAAMSGDFLETYPNLTDANENYYLKQWVDEYDPNAWSQFHGLNFYDNSQNDNVTTETHALLFMYHPHGRPNDDVVWAGGAQLTPEGGTASASVEDIYWILYAPRTSVAGEAAGRQFDGYVMAAWNGNDDWTFDGTVSKVVVVGGSDDVVLEDLTFVMDAALDVQ
jgi:prepilin-type N-terminal cleavage/methylation domain-containing protein